MVWTSIPIPPSENGAFLLTRWSRFCYTDDERRFSARPKSRWGCIWGPQKKLLIILEAIFCLSRANGVFEGKMGNITMGRATNSENAADWVRQLITDTTTICRCSGIARSTTQKSLIYSIKLAKRKRNPRKYFAFIWSSANLAKTVDYAAQIDCSGRKPRRQSERHKQKSSKQPLSISIDGLNKPAQTKRSYNPW